MSAGRLCDLFYPGPHRPGAGGRSVRRGEEWTRTCLPHIPRGGSQAARCTRLGGNLLLHAGGKNHVTPVDSPSAERANLLWKLNVHYCFHKISAAPFLVSG